MPVKTQETYEETFIPKAAEAYAMWSDGQKHQGELFINVVSSLMNELTAFDKINDAAEDSIEYGSDYLGTLHLVPGAAPAWLDLTDHGHAIDEEAKQEAVYEEAHEREVNLTKYSGGVL